MDRYVPLRLSAINQRLRAPANVRSSIRVFRFVFPESISIANERSFFYSR